MTPFQEESPSQNNRPPGGGWEKKRPDGAGRGWPGLLSLGISALLGLLAIGRGSFWIDEGISAFNSLQPGLAALWASIADIPSDAQLAFYYFQLWGWEKLVGSGGPWGEWALRLNNYPWFALGLLAWFFAMPRRFRAAVALLAGLSPFLCYYVGELRPYAMLFGASSLLFAGLARWLLEGVSRRWMWAMGVGAVLAAGASSAALPWVGVAFLGALFLWFKNRAEGRRLPFPWGMLAALSLPGACIVSLSVFTFLHGGRVVSPAASTVASLLFAPYELLGFAGLGPDRETLRTLGAGSLRPFLAGIVPLAAVLCVVLAAGLRELVRRLGGRAALGWAALFLLPAATVVTLGLLTGLRTTGRHLTPAISIALPLLAVGVGALWSPRSLPRSSRWFGRAAVIALLLLWGASCLHLRLSPRLQRDDYREAAALAKAALAKGERVWWAADPSSAKYYGLPLRKAGDPAPCPPAALRLHNVTALPPERPGTVFINRPDIYDHLAKLARWLAAEGYTPRRTPRGFTVWQREESPKK